MLCPKCSFENPDKAKFCMEWAAPLKDKEIKSDQDGFEWSWKKYKKLT